MGLYDRDYSRSPEPGIHFTAPQSATVQLILITVGVYLLQLFFPVVTQALRLNADWFVRPWEAYRLLTYGFLHSTGETPTIPGVENSDPGIRHIIFNMFGLWLFGRELEQRYGKRRFVIFYLSAIVFAGLLWSISDSLTRVAGSRPGVCLGASGGVVAVVILFALLYPHVQILFMMVFPMPMWVLGMLIVAQDLFGAVKQSGGIAFAAHLGGAAFALLFYKTGWLPGGKLLDGGKFHWRPRPKLRVHEPDDDPEDDELSQKVDAILQKIQEQGQDSLTWSERRILERASREYKQKRQ